MNPNKALWEKGDFTRIAATMRESGDALVEKLGVTKGMKVLDLGCGDGTTALPSARRGADVLGVDISGPLVEAGNRRAQAEGLENIRFQEGDASNLSDLADGTLNFVDQVFVSTIAIDGLEPRDAELQRHHQLAGRVVQLEAPVRTQVARADDHAAQRRGPADGLEAHRSNQPAGDSGAPGAPPCPPAGGAAQRTAFASTRRTSGWW